jgi:MoxR-like ATPase
MQQASPLNTLRDALSTSLIERDGEIDAALLGLVAREHVLFVGPPGTAKSQLATSLTRAINGACSFGVLLTKFTTPEELFGPVKLSALRDDRYERAIDGYAPTAEILFTDEIWKASSAILNTLLTLLQERAYDNGGARLSCPLRLAIAASNEWPSAEDGQELGAIFDRFLIRRVVRPVSPQGRARLLYDVLPAVAPCITLDEIDAAADEAAALGVGEDARTKLAEILDELAAAGVRPGDRRTRKAVGVARAAAWLAGAAEVETGHLECLADVLWADPEQAEKCAEIVTRIANPVGAALNEMLREIDEVVTSAGGDSADRMAAIKKLEDVEKRAKALSKEGNGRAQKVVQHVRAERIRLQAAALGIDPAKAAQLLGSAA